MDFDIPYKHPDLTEYDNKTVLLRDTVHQTSRGESVATGLTTVLFYVCDVKNTKFNQ